MEFRTQFSKPLDVRLGGFTPSEVQPGMSPSISQMVRTRTVGGNLDEYQMNGIDNDAPFESEYVDFFDLQDMIQNGDVGSSESPALERQNAELSSAPGKEAPPNSENADNKQVSE